MKSLNEIQHILKSKKQYFREKYAVKSIGIFGSLVRGDFNENSDADIILEYEKPMGLEFVSLANELESFLQMKTDVVSRDGIKPKYWELIKDEIVYV